MAPPEFGKGTVLHENFSLLRHEYAVHDFEKRTLARSVWTQYAQNFTSIHMEINSLNGLDLPVSEPHIF